MAYAALLAFTIRRRRWIAAVVTLVVPLALAAASMYDIIPGVRVRRIIGCDPASMVVHRLREVPTFGDGTRW